MMPPSGAYPRTYTGQRGGGGAPSPRRVVAPPQGLVLIAEAAAVAAPAKYKGGGRLRGGRRSKRFLSVPPHPTPTMSHTPPLPEVARG